MKCRFDFVSNSSSSSFIIIANKGNKSNVERIKMRNEKYNMCYDVPSEDYGCCEFNWQNEKYNTIEDKLNWCGIILLELYAAYRNAIFRAALQDTKPNLLYDKYDEWHNNFIKWSNMLKKVCKERLGFRIYLNLDFLKLYGEDDEAYLGTFNCGIDHQSGIFENPLNGKMFESEDTLYNFLAYEDSYIQCGNDNY